MYKNKLIHPHRRCATLTSLVVSRLTVGAGAWPPLKLGEGRSFRGALYAMYCAILCLPAQMVRRGPPQLWAITKCDRPYCDLMLGSFRWLFEKVGSTCGLPDPASSWALMEATIPLKCACFAAAAFALVCRGLAMQRGCTSTARQAPAG